MIVWLASYPRSGNTLLRMILRQSFGVQSYSIYNDRTDIAKNQALSDLVGHRAMEMPAAAFIRQHTGDREITFLKTHDAPVDASPAIYVVRDGRAAIISYYNYLRNIRDRSDLQIADVVRGAGIRFGSWSENIQSWAPNSRPRTLVLRYEELVADGASAVEQIWGFTRLSPIAAWKNQFERMRAIYPDFFGSGSNGDNIEKLRGDDEKLFWQLHGTTMHEFGYPVRPEV